MRWSASTLLAFALLTSVTTLLALPQDDVRENVLINGNRVSSKRIDGQLYIKGEDVARALGASVTYSSAGMSINTTPESKERKLNGSIKGSLTYYFNTNYGNKPDSGAGVWLLPGAVFIGNNDTHMSLLDTEYLVGKGRDLRNGTKYKVTKHSLTDGNGNFEFTGVPEGEYSVIMTSRHVNGKETRDLLGTTVIKRVSVKSGEVVDVSTDFGMSYYSGLP